MLESDDMQGDAGVLPQDVKQVLVTVGWGEERDMSTAVDAWARELGPGFPLFPAARDALRRFGGIRVEQSGPGEECARESFELDPTLALGEHELFRAHEGRLNTHLFPLGEAGNGHVFVAVSEEGRVFALMEDLWLLGNTMEEALTTLIRGRLPAPVQM